MRSGSFPSRHDPGTKTILGRTAAFDTDGLAALLLDHPATSRRLAWRLCHEFFGEGAVDDGRDSMRWPRACATTTSTSAGASRRCSARGSSSTPPTWAIASSSPIEYVVGAVRALEMFDPSPSTPVLADWCGRLGQDLFYPPNVGGWPGGRAWITTRSAIGRANFAAALVERRAGRPEHARSTRSRWPTAMAEGRNPSFFARLLLGADGPEVPLDAPGPARQALVRLLASPEAQRI